MAEFATKMNGVREYRQGAPVLLRAGKDKETDRLTIESLSPPNYDSVSIDLLDLIDWLKINRPELLE